MIKTKSELRECLREDAKRQSIRSWKDYVLKLFYGNENAHAFRYIRVMRKYEYYSNTRSLLRFWYRFRHRRLGLRYRIMIPINTVGKGLYIPHFEGGGNFKLQISWL